MNDYSLREQQTPKESRYFLDEVFVDDDFLFLLKVSKNPSTLTHLGGCWSRTPNIERENI